MQHIDEADEEILSLPETFIRVMCIDGDVVRGRSLLETYSFHNAVEIIDINVETDEYDFPTCCSQ